MITFIYDDTNKHHNLDRVVFAGNHVIPASDVLPNRTDSVCYPYVVYDIDALINLLEDANASLSSEKTRILVNSFLSAIAIVIFDERMHERHTEVYNALNRFLDKNFYASNRVFVIVPAGVSRTQKKSFISINQTRGTDAAAISSQISDLLAVKVTIATSNNFVKDYLNINKDLPDDAIIGHESYKQLEFDKEIGFHGDSTLRLVNRHMLTPFGFDHYQNTDIMNNLDSKVTYRTDYSNIIGKNEISYIWPIEVAILTYTHGSWKPNSDIIIPSEVIDDFNNNRVIFSFHQAAEGYINRYEYKHFVINVLKRIGADVTKWKTRVMFFHGNAKDDISDSFPGYFCNLYYFFNWVSGIVADEQINFKLTKESRLYNFLSRRPRPHRVRFVAETLKRNLEHSCILSLGDEDYESMAMPLFSAADSGKLMTWIGYSPDGIDHVNDNPVHSIDRPTFVNTLLSVVGETHVNNEVVFLSEKIFKPIAAGHPFMLLGNPRSLELLHSMGFNTFSTWWDESYDTESDFEIRVHMIHNELERLAAMPWWKLGKIRNEMQATVNHNRKRFAQILSDRYASLNAHQPMIEQWHKFEIERLIRENKI